MAIFSRTKSRAKKATEREVSKVDGEEKTITLDDALKRGRKGKEAIRPSEYDYESVVPPISGPSQPSRSFYNTSNGRGSAHTRSDSFEGSDYLTALNGKPDYSDKHSSSDSGYSSAGLQSRSILWAPAVQRENGCFQISNKSTTPLTLGEETARETSFSARRPSLQDDSIDRSSANLPKPTESIFLRSSRSLQGMRSYFRPDHGVDTPPAPPNQPRYQDARYQRQIQQSMPMRPTSVPPQVSRSRSERLSRPPPQCSSSSSGAVLQGSRSAYALRSLAAVPSSSRLPYDWSNQIPSNLDQQLQGMPLQPRPPTSPTSPTSHKTPSRQSEYTPPLSILDGLKVNKRGLILDEEGDSIGELYEGDIIDCVREKADAHGTVLDEYGRVVGRVRTLLRKDEEPMLRWKASNAVKLHGFPRPPVSVTSLAAKSPRSGDAGYSTPDQPAQTQKSVIVQKGSSSSLSRLQSGRKRQESVEQDAESITAPRDSLRGSDVISQGQSHEQIFNQQELAAPHPQPHARSDSLASVPESHSTAKKQLSDDGSFLSIESQQELANDGMLIGKRVRASSSARTGPHGKYPMFSHGRSVSDPMRSTTALPPISPQRTRPLKPNQARLFPAHITTTSAHTQCNGLVTTSSRVQSLPPPSFPGRGLAGGVSGNSPFAGCPIPGMPASRLTTSALSASPPPGMASLNTQLPALRPRISGTIPLVRSPLSSQDNSPPDSEYTSAADDSESASPQAKGPSRSQSVKMLRTTASAMSMRKQRKIFAHTESTAANKETDVFVKDIGYVKGPEKKEKKKGIKALFGWKN